MQQLGYLEKLKGTLLGNKVSYSLNFDNDNICIDSFVGKEVCIKVFAQIRCVGCRAPINKTFNQGFCYKCFITLACNDICMLKPETCHFQLGTCREPEWGKSNCFISHTIYLANSSGLKVGITRTRRKLQRWVDQGAVQAIPLFEVADRKTSGVAEVLLKEHYKDRTNWRKMLQNNQENINLEEQREKALAFLPSDFPLVKSNEPATTINYPVLSYLDKIKSLKIEQEPLKEKLLGIKAQYFIFSSGVVNLKKFYGHKIQISL
jgi:hypothetical protein